MRNRLLWTCFILLAFFLSAQSVSMQPDSGTELEVLSVNNVDRLTEIARFGTGNLTHIGAWSPHKNQFAVGGSIGIWLYDMSDLQQSPALLDLDTAVTGLVFLDEGQYLAYTTMAGAYVLDMETDTVVLDFPGAMVIANHPNDSYLLINYSRVEESEEYVSVIPVIEVWDVVERTLIESFTFTSGSWYVYVEDIAVSPDERFVAAFFSSPVEDTCGHRDSFVAIWDQTAGEEPFVLYEAENVAFSPDSRMFISEEWLSSGPDIARLHILDLETFDAQILETLPPSPDRWGYIDWFGFNPLNGELMTVSEGVLRFWDLSELVKLREINLEQDIFELLFDDTGRAVGVGRDGLTIWNNDFQVIETVTFESPLLSADLIKTGDGASWIDNEGYLHLWRFDEITLQLNEVFISDAIPDSGYPPILSANGEYLTYRQDQYVNVISTITSETVSQITDTTFPMFFNHDSTRLVLNRTVESNESFFSYIQLWDLTSNSLLREFGPFDKSDGFISAQLNIDSSWIGIHQQDNSGHHQHTIFDVVSGSEVYTYTLDALATKWTPDLQTLIVQTGDFSDSSNYAIRPLEPNYESESNNYAYSGYVSQITADGTAFLFVTSSHQGCGGDARQLYVHSLPDMALRWTMYLPVGYGGSTDGQFDSTGTLLFRVNAIFDAESGELYYQFPEWEYDAMRFSRDNRYILTISDGILRVWGVPVTDR